MFVQKGGSAFAGPPLCVAGNQSSRFLPSQARPAIEVAAMATYIAMPLSKVLGEVLTPPMVKSMLALPSEDRIVTVCVPTARVLRYTAFR